MSYNPRDHYFLKAKKEGYLARSVYKLEEIQQKHKVIGGGNRVLDLGCAPGSWSQYVLKILGGKGYLLGIDLLQVNVSSPNAKFIAADVFEVKPETYGIEPFDVVLSDMAPKTSGIAFRDQALSEEMCHKVIAVADEVLKKGGNIVMKFFMGSGLKEIEIALKGRYQNVHIVRPKGTRNTSTEVFIVGLKKKTAKTG